MTFHVGQAVVCVDASPPKWLAAVSDIENVADYTLTERAIYRVQGVMNKRGLVGLVVCGDRRGWLADRFRPLVHDDDNAELIARIKACQPHKTPVAALPPGEGAADAVTPTVLCVGGISGPGQWAGSIVRGSQAHEVGFGSDIHGGICG